LQGGRHAAGNAGAALSARQDAARSFAAQLRIEPFKLDVPEAALADLRQRLARTRFADEPPLEPWSTGTSLAHLRELVAHWKEGFDWRAHEARINRLRQFTVSLHGIELHFIHEPGGGINAMPLLL